MDVLLIASTCMYLFQRLQSASIIQRKPKYKYNEKLQKLLIGTKIASELGRQRVPAKSSDWKGADAPV